MASSDTHDDITLIAVVLLADIFVNECKKKLISTCVRRVTRVTYFMEREEEESSLENQTMEISHLIIFERKTIYMQCLSFAVIHVFSLTIGVG